LVYFKDFKCFGSDAATIGAFFETAYRRKNSLQVGIIQLLSKRSKESGLYIRALMVMLFSDEVKRQTFI
jgi:trans-2-enoyl-CoA reductase